MPSTTTALNRLLTKREASLNRPVFVAECDIKAFFDCVSHDVARAQFERLASQNPEQIDPRAIRIFNAFLDSYSFQENVRQRLLPEFKRKFPNGVIKWPEPELRKLHGDVAGKRIGVPQGGALSGLIANLVLDLADRRVRAALAQSDDAGGEYLRYCDDMILVTTSERSCQQAFDAYLAALVELKLPYHPPKRVVVYGAAFWNGKSRHPYCWTGRKWFNCVPWIQFVGYQIRYDGLLRIRKTSIEKQALKLVEKTGRIIDALVPRAQLRTRAVAPSHPDTPFSRESALASLSGSLSAMSVGLASGNARIDGPRPLCWANAFRGLHKRPLVAGPLRMLDHIRRRQISRFKRKQITYGDQQRPQGWGGQPLRVRRRGSFVGQFKNKGGQDLIRNPYRADQQEKKWREPVYLVVSKVWNWFSR